MNSKSLCAVDKIITLTQKEILQLERLFKVEIVDFSKIPFDQLECFDLALIHSKIMVEQLKYFKKCRYIGVRAHNTDYIDRATALELDIMVRGIAQVGANAVAEHTFSLIFAVAKQILLYNRNVVSGKWRDGLNPNYELRGKNLGIIGYGKIGALVADIGRALGMNIYIAQVSSQEDNRFLLEEVLKQSDVLTLHASTTGLEEPLINKAQIEKMKDGAIIINTARGKLLDYAALEDALRSGKLLGAGLDVFPDEPVADTSLCQLPNVICTPHLAYFTDLTISKMNQQLIDNAIEFFTDR